MSSNSSFWESCLWGWSICGGTIFNGSGAVFNEDKNLETMLLHDDGIRMLLHADVQRHRRSGSPVKRCIRIDQGDYSIQDLQFSFGAIDCFSYEADLVAGSFHAWFLDRYEWHPVYDGMYPAGSSGAFSIPSSA